MARRIKGSDARVDGKSLVDGPPGEPQLVRVEARRLRTIDDLARVEADEPGTIYRIRPGERNTETSVEELRAFLLANGAAAVRVLPRPRASTLPRLEEPSKAPNLGVRAAAMELVEGANTRDREGLRAAVERSLAAAGL